MPNRIPAVIVLACLLAPGAAAASDRHTVAPASSGPWTATEPAASRPDADQRASVTASTAELPLCFEQNAGQTDEQVAFLAHAHGFGLFLTSDQMVLSLPRAVAQSDAKRAEPGTLRAHRATTREVSVLRMRLEGAMRSTPVGEERLETRTNYFLGNDPDRWRTDVPNFARVRYPEVYPGVDLVYHSEHGLLEYDFEIAPGADPSRIVLAWDGAESVDVDASGTLVLKVAGGEVRQAAPAVYQETDAGTASIAGRFAAGRDGRVEVRLGAYDATRPLVIDPVLSYSTYLGGSGWDVGTSIAVDSSGAAYVTGWTTSTDFPTTASAFDTTINAIRLIVFVTKLNAAGNALVYSTYLGGNGGEYGWDIAVDSAGQAYVTGDTGSTDFPTVRAFDATANGNEDVFVTKLSPAGNALSASTYLGGRFYDGAYEIALSPTGAYAYVVGITSSSDFPTASAFDTTLNDEDVFVAKLAFKLSGTFLYYSTYLGGSDDEFGVDIAVDASGSAYVTGYTTSSDFPTAAAFDATLGGGSDVFVTKLSPSGTGLVYSTYLGGSGSEFGGEIAVDAAGSAYVIGFTYSSDLPTASPFDATFGGVTDVFVTKIS